MKYFWESWRYTIILTLSVIFLIWMGAVNVTRWHSCHEADGVYAMSISWTGYSCVEAK